MSAMGSDSQPLFSIIVPVYNTEEYLRECLDSLKCQSFKDVEIICVDDGSQDGSLAILNDYASLDQRIKVIRKENGGVSSARNVGLDVARGHYVMFVDSDDHIALDSCARLKSLIDAEDPDIVVFGGETFPPVLWIDGCLASEDKKYEDGFDALFHGKGSYPLMCNKMYRRNLIERNSIRFNEELHLGEDNAFQFCIFPHASVVSFCSDNIYKYRCEREGSALAELYSDRKLKIDRHFKIIEYVFKEWDRQGFIRKNEADLVRWMVSFLYDDVRYLAFDDRKEFACIVRDCLHRYSVSPSSVPADFRDIADFVFSPPDLATAPVRVSVILNVDGSCDSLDGLLSLEKQFEQRIELICVCADEREAREKLGSIVGRDSRARFVEVPHDRQISEFVNETVVSAKGDYVLFANLNDSYEPKALQMMVEAAEKMSAEVVTVLDTTHMLRVQSLKRDQVMMSYPPREPEQRTVVPVSYDIVGAKLFSFASLAACNKLFSREYLLSHPVDPSDFSTVAASLMNAKRIVALDERLVTLKPLAGITQQAAEKWAKSFLDGYRKLKVQLIDSGSYASAERGFVNAALNGLCCFLDLFRSRQYLMAVYPLIRQFVSEIVDPAVHDKGWFYDPDDYEIALLAEKSDFDEFFCALHFKRLDSIRGQLAWYESENKELRERLSSYFKSITFRAGRAVTLLPRKVLGALKR